MKHVGPLRLPLPLPARPLTAACPLSTHFWPEVGNKSGELENYLISASEYNKLEKAEREKTAKTEEYDLVNKIKNAPNIIWKEIEVWLGAQTNIRISGSDSDLLRDAQGMNEIFSPSIGQAKRLFNIYNLVKEFGFEKEL